MSTSNTMKRKETTILPLSAIDGTLSHHSNPVIKNAQNCNQRDNEDEDTPVISNISELNLPEELESRMFSHQREGVQWLYGLHFSHLGGILGDDMGLGKTFQVNCLLTGLFTC